MIPQRWKDLAAHRLDLAGETFKGAKILIEEKHYRGGMNRIYYSLFYAVSALAAVNGFSTSKHKGLINWFNLNYVKTNRISLEMGKLYQRAFGYRMDADYTDMFEVNPTEVLDFASQVEPFIQEIARLTQEILDQDHIL